MIVFMIIILNKENLFPRYQFFLRVKGTKNDKDKKKR